MTEELLKQINAKLDKLIAITAIQGKQEDKQAEILRRAGFTYNEIGQLIGIPSGTLRARKSRGKNER